MFDGKQLGEAIVAQVKGFMEREIAPLRAENAELKERIAALEERPAPEKGDPGEKGADGVSPDPEDLVAAFVPAAQELIAAEVARAVAALPPPEKGDKGDPGDRGEPGEKGADGKDGQDGRDGKDAANIVEALKDSGELVLTLQDGRLIRTGIRDGEKGADGRDGFGFDDMDACVLDDDRTIELSFRRGDEEKCFTFKWPTPIYRGIYREGEEYAVGDAVTWAGSLWIAEKQTSAKPDTVEGGWRLAVKKGRDGKDAKGAKE